jgi:hypothetical protein
MQFVVTWQLKVSEVGLITFPVPGLGLPLHVPTQKFTVTVTDPPVEGMTLNEVW